MTEIQFSIVGLKYYLDEEGLGDFLNNAVGRDVVIILEPDNIFDCRAVKVLLDGSMIGHVRSADVKEKGIYQMLISSRHNSYSAKVTGIDHSYVSLSAEIKYNGTAFPQSDFYTDYGRWAYNGYVLNPIEEWKKLHEALVSMLTLLENGTATHENLSPLMAIFKEYVIYGFSKDFFEDRKELFNALNVSADSRIKSFAEEIKSISSLFHNDKLRSKAYSRIQKGLKKQVEGLEQELGCDQQELRRQLRAFPNDLFAMHEKKFGIFPSRLYYAQIPRKQLLEFLSGVAIYSYIVSRNNESPIKKKRRVGRPQKSKMGKNRLCSRFKGDSKDRKFWFDYMKELIDGKKNKAAAEVVGAFIKEDLMTNALFDELNDAFENVGNKNGYNEGVRYYKEHAEELAYYRELIRKKKTEYLMK